MKLKIIIYHGLKGSGKTTQLATLLGSDIESSKKVIAERVVLKTEYGNILHYDDCDLKKDLLNIPTTGIDWLYLSTEKLPGNYRKLIWNYFGEKVYDVRECMFPLCNYIYKYEKAYWGDMGAIAHGNKTRAGLIKLLSVVETKEVSIPDMDGMRSFLESNKVAPRNFREWGLDYAHLMKFYEKFNKMTDDKVLVTDDEACAIANYCDGETEWIEDLFFNLFNEDLPF